MLQGAPSFLPPPNDGIQNKTVLNWPPPEITVSPGLATPKNRPSPELATPKLTNIVDFLGWQILDLVISRGGQFRTEFWHIGKFGGGKKDGALCT